MKHSEIKPKEILNQLWDNKSVLIVLIICMILILVAVSGAMSYISLCDKIYLPYWSLALLVFLCSLVVVFAFTFLGRYEQIIELDNESQSSRQTSE